MHKLIALQVFQIQFRGLERVAVLAPRYLHPNVLEQLDEVVDVTNVGNILYGDLVTGQQRGTDNLQRLVLGALWLDGATQQVSAFYLE